MVQTKREIERKYEAASGAEVPDLTGVSGIADVVARGVAELDAVYYDTAELRLVADGITLRRRTGGGDEGWHLKFPVSAGIRDEIREPLADTLPRTLSGLVRSRTRGTGVVPVVRLVSKRDVRHLVDDQGELLAELSVDSVRAERVTSDGGTAAWTEIEVELADDADPMLLDAVEKRLRKAGITPSPATSKLARALAETAPKPKKTPGRKRAHPTAGDHVLTYIRHQTEAIVALDPAVRRDLPDSVHQMRVATRRLRSALRTYGKILDRGVTDPVGDELKWLAAELGIDRDQEVLDARLCARLDGLSRTLILGPVRSRLGIWSVARRGGSRRRTVGVLDGTRYLALLDSLDALLAAPPLLPAASSAPERALPRAVLKEYERLATRVGHALELPPGEDRDLAMHDARKAAKRARYAAEAAGPALGKPAKRFARRMKALQTLLGDHQDSVVARDALRTLAVQAHAAGEPGFTWGLLYGREEATAAAGERELPGVWERASRPRVRSALER
ncbi:CHAD domain-containing protein [Streptomyces sp. NPDC058092]|uniref:CYTH and CHAD domain-containing protein n=1 Tax=Streptomyces sp. NPDC058092 TaxID=3346336 RepID=UPI0036EF2877